MLEKIIIPEFRNSAGTVQQLTLSYQVFGPPIGSASVVLVHHALSGNSQVSGENGWWKELVGSGKAIDTEFFTVLCFNIPGNGFADKENIIHNYTEFTLKDIARIFLQGLEKLKIEKLFAIIGGSIGGALAWELAALSPYLAEHIIPIAADHKVTAWVLAQTKVQDQILNNSVSPVHDARLHAMTFYRTPQSFRKKFGNRKSEINKEYEMNNWLLYHGENLEKRFSASAYRLMNHLLSTIDVELQQVKAKVHMISVDTDWFFLAEEDRETYKFLSEAGKEVAHHEIRSIHGHDAFLIEYDQIITFLEPIFSTKLKENESNKSCAVWNG